MPVELPQPPQHLPEPARDEWQRVVSQLADHDAASLSLLESYVVSFARWRHAEAELEKTGPVVRAPNGGAMQSPWLSVSRAAARDCRQVLVELGLTPKARKKIGKPEQNDLEEQIRLLEAS